MQATCQASVSGDQGICTTMATEEFPGDGGFEAQAAKLLRVSAPPGLGVILRHRTIASRGRSEGRFAVYEQ